ncbi:hypothetical protein PsorP6_000026 [Peronosclerospora sorghi]|uniref:Uncharacterized protein n=1 Tax=Peronosclerospora sorghi TaxID=230839 RepID=A0ACC0WS18_9STRA|nr:hypothetical protein PsorP6_000026 [Peronosclerospora sorghi]
MKQQYLAPCHCVKKTGKHLSINMFSDTINLDEHNNVKAYGKARIPAFLFTYFRHQVNVVESVNIKIIPCQVKAALSNFLR